MNLEEYKDKYVIIPNCFGGYYVVMKVISVESVSDIFYLGAYLLNHYPIVYRFIGEKTVVLGTLKSKELNDEIKFNVAFSSNIECGYCHELDSVKIITKDDFDSIITTFKAYAQNINKLTKLIKIK